MNNKSNLELLTIISSERAAVALFQLHPTLTSIAQCSVDQLERTQGVSPREARRIKAALTLAVNLSQEVCGESPVLDNPEAVARYLREENRLATTENFVVLALNSRRRLIKKWTVATGTLDTILVHAREVFRQSIVVNASAIVLSHGHPGGDPTPSDADCKVTRDLIRAGQLLKIEVIDHVILGRATPERPKDYASLRELGYFYS